jgi:hypothetical protein
VAWANITDASTPDSETAARPHGLLADTGSHRANSLATRNFCSENFWWYSVDATVV